MGKYLIKDIKDYNDELADLFLDYEDSDILNDCSDYIEDKDGDKKIEISELIWQTADNKFIYYSAADEYLGDFDIWEEIEDYKCNFGDTPKNQCQLAAFIYDREIRSKLYEAFKNIEEYEEKEE